LIWHLITSEFPPQPGGVSDYTHLIGAGLAAAGDEVHVWCPPAEDEAPPADGVTVHRELGHFAPSDLRRVGRRLDEFEGPRTLLVQWVPHGYGYRAMNLPFCLWLRRRARQGDRVDLMVHEPFLDFRAGSWKQKGVAAVHRLMTMVLLKTAHRVWISVPAWEARWRPYSLGRSLRFNWLPVPSNIPVVDDPAGVEATRARYASANGHLVGHFGTCDRNITRLLLDSMPALLQNGSPHQLLLVGRGSETMRAELVRRQPALADRVHATGQLSDAEVSLHVSACDVMFQPYIDGVSSRRTSVMVGLAHGVPIVTTKGELTESLWADSQAVSLAAVADVPAMVNETRLLLADETKRIRLGSTARALYQDRFDVKHSIASLRSAAV
jgi:glycosyltransferase involved in cell wall biosynthesis